MRSFPIFEGGLAGALEHLAARRAAHTAAVIDGERATFASLHEYSVAVARALHDLGVRRGDRVGILLPSSVTWLHAFFGALQLRAVPVALDPLLGRFEARILFEASGIRVCFTDRVDLLREISPGLPDLRVTVSTTDDWEDEGVVPLGRLLKRPLPPIHEVAPLEPREPLMMACTAGTTGAPKIVLLEHQGCVAFLGSIAEYLGFTADDVLLLAMPLYHLGGLGFGLQPFLSGGTVLYQTRFAPRDFVALIERERVSRLVLTATLAKMLLGDPGFRDVLAKSVETVLFGGEPLPEDLARVFYGELGLRTINVVGSTEAGVHLVWDSQRDAGTPVNHPRALDFVKLRIIDDAGALCSQGQVGSIQVANSWVLREYFRNPEATRQAIAVEHGERWWDTGDLGEPLPGGRVRLAGRKKRIIKRGPNLVHPEEVERFLLAHPLVAAVAVLSEPDPAIGERIVALVQPVPGAQLERQALVSYCRNELTAYKIPDRFEVVAELPIDGKIRLHRLHEDRNA